MRTIFLPPADKKLEDAVVYYNDQLDNLGENFLQEVSTAIKLIEKFLMPGIKLANTPEDFSLSDFHI